LKRAGYTFYPEARNALTYCQPRAHSSQRQRQSSVKPGGSVKSIEIERITKVKKRVRALLTVAIVLIGLFGNAQQSQAAYYPIYYSYYQYYVGLYDRTGNTGYLYGFAYPAYYYYLGGLHGDYNGVYSDPWGSKSTAYSSFTYAGYYYNLYDYYGDFYYRNY
jgi:hypothetical protein